MLPMLNSDPAHLSPAIRNDIARYLASGMAWGIIAKCINRMHGTAYTSTELQKLWKNQK